MICSSPPWCKKSSNLPTSQEFSAKNLPTKKLNRILKEIDIFWVYFYFSPLIGEIIKFNEHIFQTGWFNHQPGFFTWRRQNNFTLQGRQILQRRVSTRALEGAFQGNRGEFHIPRENDPFSHYLMVQWKTIPPNLKERKLQSNWRNTNFS